MISSLTGVLVSKHPPALVIDVHGVGYELEAPMTTFYDLPESGQQVSVHTHLVVREDAQLLFAFSSNAQRDAFRSLLKVSGIGPRVALAILSTLTIEEFHASVVANDITRLTRVPGIGRKTAERLVVEMRDRVSRHAAENPPPVATEIPPDPVQDAVGALIALGYKGVEASRAVQGVSGQGMESEELIRQALRQLAGSHL